MLLFKSENNIFCYLLILRKSEVILRRSKMAYSKDYVDYKVSVLLNELGVKSYDFSNAENNEKVDAVKEQIFALINSLPKLK